MVKRCKIDVPPAISRAQVSAIVLDAEFRDLVPQPTLDESAERVRSAFQDGVSEPLYVWAWKGKLVLLVGYHLFPTLRLHRITFPIITKEFPDRAEARRFIIQHHLRYGLLSSLAFSYFRGSRCWAQKLDHGGDHKSEAFRTHFGPRKALATVAKMYHVSRQTLWNDMAFAQAVDTLAAHCGSAVKPLILARESRFTRGRVIGLAAQPPAQQRRVMEAFQTTGRLPRSLRRTGPATITVPRQPITALAAKLRERLTQEEVDQLRQELRGESPPVGGG